jgi:hypothetical protein
MMSRCAVKGLQLLFGIAAMCFTIQVLAAVEVELKVDDSVTPVVLDIETNDSMCGTDLRCIKVDLDTKPHMFFHLKQACKTGGPDYKLKSFRITQIDKFWPSTSNPLNLVVATDFYADPETGYVDLAAGKNKLRNSRIKLKNFNTHEYTVYYEISAEHCDDPTNNADIYLDPEIRNKGNN